MWNVGVNRRLMAGQVVIDEKAVPDIDGQILHRGAAHARGLIGLTASDKARA